MFYKQFYCQNKSKRPTGWRKFPLYLYTVTRIGLRFWISGLNMVVRVNLRGNWQERSSTWLFGKCLSRDAVPLKFLAHLTIVIPQRIQFKVALIIYKAMMAINNLAPDYITSYCRSSSTNDHRSTLRSADKAILIKPKTRTKCGKKSFSYAGPHRWNQLPLCVRHMQDRISGINYHCVSDICIMQDRISGINYHCVSDNHHPSTFIKPGLKHFCFLSLTVITSNWLLYTSNWLLYVKRLCLGLRLFLDFFYLAPASTKPAG